MRRVLIILASVAAFMCSAVQVFAAPLWIERQFIPKPELVDPRFQILSDTHNASLDHSLWDSFLNRYVTASADGVNRVRYSAVDAQGLATLQRYITMMEAVDTSTLSSNQKLAYWINLYNAATMRMIVQNYPISSIRKIKVEGEGPWDHPIVTVQKKALTLSEIEHHIVRALFPDPRVHYALNCAAVGCPSLALQAYRAETLDDMLEAGAVAYINHPRGVSVRKNKADISKIYGWYLEDFGDDEAAVLQHLKTYARGDLLTALQGVKKIGRYDYDWSLNDATIMAEPSR